MPQSKEEWIDISINFEHKWNMPNCIGALDGKHINISALGCRVNVLQL